MKDMETELSNPPSAEYIPQLSSKPVLQPMSPKKKILQQTRSLLNSVFGDFGGFCNLKETSSPTTSKKGISLPFANYLKQSKIFVLRSSQESNEEKSFETVTDTHKPYIHCMMSGAIIASPYAFKQVGIPMGITFVVCFAFLMDYCTLILMQNSILTQQDTYQGIIRETFGNKVFWFLSSFQVLFYISSMTFYHALLGDMLPKMINRLVLICGVDDFQIGRQFSIAMSALLILVPLSLCRSIRLISKFSLISFFCITSLITFSLIRLTTISRHVPYTHSPFRFSNMNAFQSIGIIVFMYLSHHSSYIFNASIRDSSKSRFSNTTYVNISYSLLCTLMLGIIGFITFKGLVQGDFLENYCEEDDMANIVRLCITVMIIMQYPLECHGGREIIYASFLPQSATSLPLHIGLTMVLVVLASTISIFVDCVSLILEISGLLFAVPLVIIIPCGSFLRLSKESIYGLRKLPCLVLASASFMIILLGIVMAAFMPHGCIHTTKYLPYCNGSSELL
ncbi:putative sodium-coupled neutral amino acid transporter 11 [Rhopilema esculentum]|uniref:putative sodium-coupled neutral amino acid transporter 11 n=1 Tax=Rhopilema esculentum TaxID=499914 RepID=UPI0031E457EA